MHWRKRSIAIRSNNVAACCDEFRVCYILLTGETSCWQALNSYFQAMQSHNPVSIADGRRDEPSPPALAIPHSVQLYVEGKAAFVADSMGAKALHRRSRVFGVNRQGVLSAHSNRSGHSEQIVDPARPNQAVIRKIALPAAHVVKSKLANPIWRNRIDYRAAQDQPEIEVARFVEQRPTVVKRERPCHGRCHRRGGRVDGRTIFAK